MRTRHTDVPIDDSSRDSITVADNERRISTRSSSRALTSPRVILRQRVHNRGELNRYMDPRLRARSKRKKYSSYPDIEYAAAKRTKQSSSNSSQEKQEEQVASSRSPRHTQEQLVCNARRARHTEVGECSPRHNREDRLVRILPNALKRLKSDLGEGYVEDVIRYNSSGKPYGLRRERQIVTRYEAPDFREVVHTRITTDEEEGDEDDDEEEEVDQAEEEEEESRRGSGRSYSLRRKPPKVVRYEDNSFTEQPKARGGMYHRPYSPSQDYHRQYSGSRKGRRQQPHRSSHRVRVSRRARHQSTTSESGSDTEKDEAHFEKRKKKSMNQARSKCLPMNLAFEDIQKGVFRERLKAGASMADIDPMSLDRSTDFSAVGGLDEHIKSLREMVVFPMLYPDVFDKFDIAPPRGVIFYGSPGTGKTLVARALSNECSKDGQKISFFMRKGADCLSKWVGESERQLRLLFDQAYSMRPSIIFFDEIDGLAPVRSSRQEQIHSSIVSTLLALMDGLDSRGEVVVIGATNRLDAIDPALRRPGRFDREFHFPLPSALARAEILRIHTAKWNPLPHADLLTVLADRTAGFCGADLKALVTESALSALRRRYPQIYLTNKRLLLDPASISVRAQDFYQALLKIEPAQARSNDKTRMPLPQNTRPLLSDTVMQLVKYTVNVIPTLKINTSALETSLADITVPATAVEKDGPVDLVSGEPEIYGNVSARNTSYSDISQFFSTLESYFSGVPSHRPRMLVTSHHKLVMSSFLHVFEDAPVHEVSLTTIHDPNYRSAEEAVSRIVTSAIKKTPSFLYIPNLDLLECSCDISVCNTLYTLISDIAPGAGVLVLATLSSGPALEQGSMFRGFFKSSEAVSLPRPTPEHITKFFTPLLSTEIERSFCVTKVQDASLEELEEAPPIQLKPLSDEEIAAIEKREESTLRELRLFLRDIVNKLMKERKFYCFCKPVNLEEVHDYLEVVGEPMDLEKVRVNIDRREYETVKSFIDDVERISGNAIEYNPPDDHTGRQIRHRAAELKDFLHSLLDAELDEEFATLCEEMKKAREMRAQQIGLEHTDGITRNKRHSLISEEENVKEEVNGFVAETGESQVESVVDRISEVVKDRPIDDILHLYTLLSQIIIKGRSDKSMTIDSLFDDHIKATVESFALRQ